MQEIANHLTSILPPVVLVFILVLWSLWKKEKWLMPAIVALCFSSGSLILFLVGQQAEQSGNFKVGFSVGMYASVVATIPLAAFGWFAGKKLGMRFAVLAALAGIAFNFAIAFSYQYMIKKNAEILKAEVVFDCAKVPYHCAIKENRLEEIPELKKKGFNIEARDSLSRTALWYGIHNAAAVKALLENGANPDSFNFKSETPLAYVLVMALKPDLQVAKLLIDHGAKINRTVGFRKKISILNWAIVNGNPDVINFALENGADPNFVDGWKKSPCVRLRKFTHEQIRNLNKYCPQQP